MNVDHMLGPNFAPFPGPGTANVFDLLRRLESARHSELRIVVKVKNELALLPNWLEYHSAVFGDESIIVVDCGSTDIEFVSYLRDVATRIPILSYSNYYDNLHATSINKEFFRFLSVCSRYVCIIDADEYLTGLQDCTLSSMKAKQILSESSEALLAGTWVFNSTKPHDVAGVINWKEPIEFELHQDLVRWNTVSGKAIINSKNLADVTHVGHNLATLDLCRAATTRSFGKIVILHVTRLPTAIMRDRALRHLQAKGVIPKSPAEGSGLNAQLSDLLAKGNLQPVERLYVQRCLGHIDPPHPHSTRVLVRALGGGSDGPLPEFQDAFSSVDFLDLVQTQATQLASVRSHY